jgi:hypothetical protein
MCRLWISRCLLWVALVIPVSALLSVPQIAGAQSGGDYDLTWHTIDDGGSTLSGDGYMLMGTVGQTEAGWSVVGGDYTMTSGYWAGGIHIGPSYRVLLPLVLRAR